jgi:serine/threonine protein kinase
MRSVHELPPPYGNASFHVLHHAVRVEQFRDFSRNDGFGAIGRDARILVCCLQQIPWHKAAFMDRPEFAMFIMDDKGFRSPPPREVRNARASSLDAIQDSLVLSRYVLEAVLSDTPLSRILKVRDNIDGTHCAVKVYSPAGELDPMILQVFDTQYRSFFFHSPHLLMPLRFSVLDGAPLVFMPWVKGGSLDTPPADSDAPRSPMNETQLVAMLAQLAPVLDTIHRRGSTHLDICPGNVLVIAPGRYAFTDFGINRICRNMLHHAVGPNGIMHPDYASPERYAHDTAAPDDDIFSLGVLLFEMAMGVLPWSCEGGRNLLIDASDIPVLDGRFSRACADIVARCMQRLPEDRPTARELAEWSRHRLSASAREHHRRLEHSIVD